MVRDGPHLSASVPLPPSRERTQRAKDRNLLNFAGIAPLRRARTHDHPSPCDDTLDPLPTLYVPRCRRNGALS
jgi:hypothetical protein